MNSHKFIGKWITDAEFYDIAPRNVFHKGFEKVDLPCDEHRNRHILFRKKFTLGKKPKESKIYITADDYYKLYINGKFVGQGPAPAYNFAYEYNCIDITDFLIEGENLIAVHTLYQGLINRVWVSGDNRHGMICDVVCDGETIVFSDESFLTHPHTAYTEIGTYGYDTQFAENFDSNAKEVDFFLPQYNDSFWKKAKIIKYFDYKLVPQKTKQLEFEKIKPYKTIKKDNKLFVDFGSCYAGYLSIKAKGIKFSQITVRCAQELNEDGTIRFNMRAGCSYEENWILSGEYDTLDWFDYKAFRYVELILPMGAEISDIYLVARHYPFELKTNIKPEFADNEKLRKIWDLCVNTQKYGVQEVIQDCLEREKGFYVGDGCYTALTHYVLTKDDSILKKLIDDAFKTDFISDTLVTCLDCSYMQEIAEFPLYLISLLLWYYRLSGDKKYLAEKYPHIVKLLDAYKKNYEKDGLLQNVDKWCVVEWPERFRDGYDVKLSQEKATLEPHIAINAFYLNGIKTANAIANVLGLPKYREEEKLLIEFKKAFLNKDKHLFKDSTLTEHISLIGNIYAYAFNLCDEEEKYAIERMMVEKGFTTIALFGAFPMLCGFIANGKDDELKKCLLDENAWLRMLREDATTTFESWGKELKFNTSLFHMTFSYAALFLADIDLKKLFGCDNL